MLLDRHQVIQRVLVQDYVRVAEVYLLRREREDRDAAAGDAWHEATVANDLDLLGQGNQSPSST
jgi:hypothetical protein